MLTKECKAKVGRTGNKTREFNWQTISKTFSNDILIKKFEKTKISQHKQLSGSNQNLREL